MGLRRIDGTLIRKTRGDRSMDEIVEAAKGAFTKGSLSGWENETFQPTQKNILELCQVLGCEYEQISVEIGN